MQLTQKQEAQKQAYIRARGYWKDWTEGLLLVSPNFLDTYARYGGYPAQTGPLSPAMCELIYVALDGSSTHLFEAGLRLHMGIALQRGATPLQIMEVLHIATAQGLDGVTLGVDILVEELATAGLAPPALSIPLDGTQMELKSAYKARFGDWPGHCERLLRLDPGYFAVMLDLLACREEQVGLDEQQRTLIALALAACFTGLHPEPVRLHIRRALRLGCTAAEVLQVLQMTAHLGVHACSMGVPALMDTQALDTTA